MLKDNNDLLIEKIKNLEKHVNNNNNNLSYSNIVKGNNCNESYNSDKTENKRNVNIPPTIIRSTENAKLNNEQLISLIKSNINPKEDNIKVKIISDNST